MSFYEELKRRNVVKAAVLYVVASWLILQIADVLFDAMELPSTWVRLVLAILILGFPLALIFSWVFEITPEGLQREKDVDRSQSITADTGRKVNVLIIVMLALAIAVVVMDELMAGRLDDAIASFRTALTLSPGHLSVQTLIGTALLLKGEPEAALAAVQQESGPGWRLNGLVMAYHELGQAAMSDAALAKVIELVEQVAAYNIAYVLAFRGEADRAFEWLDKAVQYNDPGLSQIAMEPRFANIRTEPRWRPFLESIGKSPEQLAAIEFEVTLPE